jgi:hypothetical protein
LWNCNIKEKSHEICAFELEEFIFLSLVTKRQKVVKQNAKEEKTKEGRVRRLFDVFF